LVLVFVAELRAVIQCYFRHWEGGVARRRRSCGLIRRILEDDMSSKRPAIEAPSPDTRRTR
jgi:hypothetical protein